MCVGFGGDKIHKNTELAEVLKVQYWHASCYVSVEGLLLAQAHGQRSSANSTQARKASKVISDGISSTDSSARTCGWKLMCETQKWARFDAGS